MDWNIVYYLLYGLISGLGELLPVSSLAHGYLIQELTQFDARQPALMLAIHFGCFLAVGIRYFRKIAHIRRETRIASLPQNKRKRQPDMVAVLDGRVLTAGLIPMVLFVAFSVFFYKKIATLPLLCIMFLLGGIVLYVPQYLPGANKDSRHLSRKDSLILGLCNGLGLIPGVSRIGTVISLGLVKGCDRGYILDMAMLWSLPMLLGLMIVDGILLMTGAAVMETAMFIYCLVASVAAFGGAWLSMMIMRYLSVKSNFFSFAYFSWGLAFFSFLVYLMI